MSSPRTRLTITPTAGHPTRTETAAPAHHATLTPRPHAKKFCASPVRQAHTTPIGTPSTPENAWVAAVRCTSRTTTAARASPADAISDGVSRCVATKTTTNTRPGSADSTSPRAPPIASVKENSSPAIIRTPRAPASGATGPTGSTGSGCVSSTSSLTGSGSQLVARVEDGRAARDVADEPVHAQAPPGIDAGDRTTTEPDQVEGAAAVVELGLERGHPLAWAQRDGPQHAGDAHSMPVAHLVHRDAAHRLLRLGALFRSLDLGLGLDRPVQDLAQAHRISVISGPRVMGSNDGVDGSAASGTRPDC